MASKPKTRKTPALAPTSADDLARKAAAEARATATIMTDGTVNSAVVQSYLSNVNGGSDVQTLARRGVEQAGAIAAGDLSQLEAMLLSQATALQAMFTSLALRAKLQDRFDAIQTMTVLALKCAAGSRQSITALAELRMPKTVMFAKQANVTSGPQQVNNGVAAPALPARAEEIQNRPSELSGASHELLQDTRASCTAGGDDPHLAAVGAINRTKDAGR